MQISGGSTILEDAWRGQNSGTNVQAGPVVIVAVVTQ
jgi:hypothetical protein